LFHATKLYVRKILQKGFIAVSEKTSFGMCRDFSFTKKNEKKSNLLCKYSTYGVIDDIDR
jgi:hypothetical protein